MKKFIILLTSLLFFGCQKSEVEPDLSEQVKGIYSVYFVEAGNESIRFPYEGITIGIELQPVSKTKANYVITTNLDSDKSTDTGIFELKQGTDQITLSEDGKETGFIRGTFFELSNVAADGSRVTIKAKK